MDAETAARRLAQLERYLAEDPRNAHLLAAACDASIAAGDGARAEAHLRAAEDLRLDPAAWGLRRAHLAMARHAWDEALQQLARVRALAGPQAAVAHDVAFVHLRRGEHAACREELAPWLEELAALDAATTSALQALWLRATHHLARLDEAWAQVERWQAQGVLHPAAAAVASLIAVDRSELRAARTLADAALQAGAALPEALVARACVALGERDAATARALLQQALRAQPEDGRTWSTLGLVALLERDPVQARAHLKRGVRWLPAHVGSWHALGWACLLQPDLPAAERAFRQALALDRNFAESHGAVGLVLLLGGRGDAAQEHLERADRLDRQNITGRYARALQRGELPDAAALRAFAVRVLDRPGLFGGRLHESLESVKE